MNSIEKNDKWIFLVPVDGDTNKKIIENRKELSKDKQNENIQIKKENSNFEEDIKNNVREKNSSINKNNKENNNNLKIYTYSLASKKKDFSLADSSKLYMSEFLKKNWKIKIKRLKIKLKKRYTKHAQKYLEEEPKDIFISKFLKINNKEKNKFIENNNSINFAENSKLLNRKFNNNNLCLDNSGINNNYK